MAKKKKSELLNIRGMVFKGPKYMVQALTSSIDGLKTTKVIQTYVIESNNLSLAVVNGGKTQFSGVVKWIGNKTDGTPGTMICVGSKNDLRMISPSEDTCQEVTVDTSKGAIVINAIERTKCSVCGKGMKIFDEVLSCPFCNSKAHNDHLTEWVKMRHSCPICKKELELNANNVPIPKD